MRCLPLFVVPLCIWNVPSGAVFADVGLSVEDDVYLLLSQLLLPIFEYGVFECCGRQCQVPRPTNHVDKCWGVFVPVSNTPCANLFVGPYVLSVRGNHVVCPGDQGAKMQK